MLLFRIRSRKDSEAFGQLYDLYIQKIYRFVFLKVSDKEEAEDITSDVFLKVWNLLIDEDKQEVKHVSALLYRIARNAVIDFYRKKQHVAKIDIETVEEIGEYDKHIQAVEQGHETQRIFEALKKMKREYQEVITMKYIDELTIGEIAEIVGKKHIAVRVTLHRAMKVLKEILTEKI